MMVKQTAGILGTIAIQQTNAWIDYDEIDSFISFIENNVIPNMNLKYKDKSSEFIFQSKEITLKFLIHEKRKRLTIELNPNYALEKKQYFSILKSNCVAVEKIQA
jgi:hypothetical protein